MESVENVLEVVCFYSDFSRVGHKDFCGMGLRIAAECGIICGETLEKIRDMISCRSSMKNDEGAIKNDRVLEFIVFCIENVAARLGTTSDVVYRAWTQKSDLLREYIVPSFETLHTQGREYIVDDICEVMAERGVKV